MERPLINNSWLMVTPVIAQRISLPICFLSIFLLGEEIRNPIQSKDDVTRTRITFNPNGLIKAGVMNFTTLKLILKIRLARKTERCAFADVRKGLFIYSLTKWSGACHQSIFCTVRNYMLENYSVEIFLLP